MTDPSSGSAGPALPESDGRSDASVVTQFFLLPLAVVAGLVGVFLLYTLATRQPPTARDHLRTLQSGRFNQRWQAAFELSNLLREGKDWRRDPALLRDVAAIFKSEAAHPNRDPRVRRYLALTLGNSESREAVPPLLTAVRDADSETRLYATWGLARLAAPEAEPLFQEGLKDHDPAVRSVSAYGLGLLPGISGVAGLQQALTDPTEEVRWNAALALARKGDAAGEPLLIKMLDRQYLDRFSSMQLEEKSTTILNALRALKNLQTKGLIDSVRHLSQSDSDPRVRKAARAWVEEMKY
jgi:HEAT repeat protein